MSFKTKSVKMQTTIDQLAKDIFGKSVTESFNDGTCPTCGNKIGNFRDVISEKEYSISGMCQECQDSVFGETDGDY